MGELLLSGYKVCVLDNFSTGNKIALQRVMQITNSSFEIFKLDIRDTLEVTKAFKSFKPDSVIHFAGLKSVSDSMKNPLEYYDHNINGGISLLSFGLRPLSQAFLA